MALTVGTLVVTNNEDGTVTYETEGSNADTHRFFSQRVTGDLPTLNWVECSDGPITEPGGNDASSTDALANGYYFFKSVQTKGSETNVPPIIYGRVTDADKAVQSYLMDATVARMDLLALTGLHATYDRELVPDGNLVFPCCLLTYDEQQETRLSGTNNKDDRGRAIKLAFIDRDAKVEEFKERTQLWRQTTDRAFQGWQPTDIGEVLTCNVEPGDIIRMSDDGHYKLSEMTLRFWCREPRGLGA